jgi:Mrp family chromosome partitioning ATPase
LFSSGNSQEACQTASTIDPDVLAIRHRLANVKHKILVLSGKGGVGKSTFATQLAYGLSARGAEVGLLDIDICGPSAPIMFGQVGQDVHRSNSGWSPVYVKEGLAVMSIGFLMQNPDDAVIWRGPRKNGLIKQFLTDTEWGNLDFLIVDAPPGTSDEHLSIVQYMKLAGIDGALVITTPQEVALADVRKEINFCAKVGVRVLGVVENMSTMILPVESVQLKFISGPDGDVTEQVRKVLALHFPSPENEVAPSSLSAQVDIFSSNLGAASRMCKWAGVPLLGQVPLDPAIATATERGCSLFSDEVGGRNQNIRNLSLGISPASFEAMKTILDNVICAISEVQSDVFKTGQL